MSLNDKSAVLEWKGYNSTAQAAFHSLFDDEEFTDVTLACDGNGAVVKAHKVILSSCSAFFSKILKQNPNPHPLIYLQGVNIEDLLLLKRFMYIGKTRVNFDQFESFMEISKHFLNQPPPLPAEVNPSLALKPTDQKGDELCPNDIEVSNILNGNILNGKSVKRERWSAGPLGRPRKSPVLSFSCLKCDFKSVGRKKLRVHKRKEHPETQDNRCTIIGCGKVYKNVQSLNLHMRDMHSNGPVNKYLCDECEYSTRWLSSFENHKRRHSGDLFRCIQCKYATVTNRLLAKHKESIHGEAKYLCEICDYKTRTERTLKDHIGKIHEGKRYFCELCKHQATSNYNLKSHKRRTHDKIKFTCNFCNYKDSEKSRVVLHEKRKHSEKSETDFLLH